MASSAFRGGPKVKRQPKGRELCKIRRRWGSIAARVRQRNASYFDFTKNEWMDGWMDGWMGEWMPLDGRILGVKMRRGGPLHELGLASVLYYTALASAKAKAKARAKASEKE
ncbi:hypothetical protein EYC84_008464 [Monilinia fructicola]|uniref:Uncharacterized protein n=1 Tax=Monilinia fructicola TaxID=38448 RepID=A0A5M9JLX3_MONFR|nr:hypothetical protein EYC84_008464 [Monilinia fructicola]